MAQTIEPSGDPDEDLRRFDSAYLDYYPYLLDYVDPRALSGRDVLEIGLGYGTLGQLLVKSGARYTGVDVAQAPVALMNTRIAGAGAASRARAEVASALELPFEDSSFDWVYSIGCLHHTGDLQRAVNEVHRVLRPGGRAVVMVYYRYSLRRLIQLARRAFHRDAQSFDEQLRGLYDQDSRGAAPPHTEYASATDVKDLFSRFSSVVVDIQNFPDISLGRLVIKRDRFLYSLARKVGLDIYVRAVS
ncbi:MAG TPA: class I SAM-dependent methyltransferase [Gemmatimonadaceae bacterium]|nr:class I SAM-dependent methyltransferase [Gemmatimonadaceae bacterium]